MKRSDIFIGFTAKCTEDCIHGTCTDPDTCTCENGWTGDTCDKCVALPGCEHGSCKGKPNSCQCDSGWQGHLCQEPICAQGCNLNNAHCKVVRILQMYSPICILKNDLLARRMSLQYWMERRKVWRMYASLGLSRKGIRSLSQSKRLYLWKYPSIPLLWNVFYWMWLR